jgi:hypothetical protein
MDNLDWRAAALDSVTHNCLANLEFRAHLAAPGYGQAWDCRVCGEHFHRVNADAPANRFEDLPLEAFELQPYDCI